MAEYDNLKELKEDLNAYCKGGILPPTADGKGVPVEDWVIDIEDLSGLLMDRDADTTVVPPVTALEHLSGCNPPIGSWDVAGVTDFSEMFSGATAFNQNIGNWDVENGEDFFEMFKGAESFNQNLRDWVFKDNLDEDAGEDAFDGAASFKQNLLNWKNWDLNSTSVAVLCPSGGSKAPTCTFKEVPDTDALEKEVKKACDSKKPNDHFSDEYGPFVDFIFNETLTDMSGLFKGQKKCDPDVTQWGVENVANFMGMFEDAKGFNQDVTGWHVSTNGLNFDNMFKGATSLRQWLIDNEKGASGWPARAIAATGFCSDGAVCTYKPFANFDLLKDEVEKYCGVDDDDLDVSYGPIAEWNIEGQTSLAELFIGMGNCTPNLARWDVADVVEFNQMFSYATKFNSDLKAWNVASGENFAEMFEYAESFNADIAGWGEIMTNADDGNFMFHGASSFVQNLTSWPAEIRNATGFCSGGAICDPVLFPSAAPSGSPTKAPTPSAAFTAGNDIGIFALAAMVVTILVR